MGKDEVVADKKRLGDTRTLGKLRFQSYDTDKIHIHDDEHDLVFEYIGVRGFQLAIEEFVRNQWQYRKKTVVMIPGEKDPSEQSRSGRKAADLILERGTTGWSLKLAKKSRARVDIILGDTTVSFLDDFIHGL